MSNPMDKLWKEYAAAQAAKEKRNEEIQAEEDHLEELKKAQDKAARDGNQEEFDRLDAEIAATKRRMIVLVKSAKAPVLTPERASEAWKETAAIFIKERGKRWTDYQKAQKDTCEKYENCALLQNDLLRDRQSIAYMAGFYDGSELEHQEIERRFPLPEGELLPGHDINRSIQDLPEASYFTGCGLWQKAPAENTLNHIVRLGRPMEKHPDFGRR